MHGRFVMKAMCIAKMLRSLADEVVDMHGVKMSRNECLSLPLQCISGWAV